MMESTLSSAFVVFAFLGVLALFAVALKWLQRRNQLPGVSGGQPIKVLSSLTVGPQQRVVTLEVGPAGQRTALVVGITAQGMRTLHQWPVDALASPSSSTLSPPISKAAFAALLAGQGHSPDAESGAGDADPAAATPGQETRHG